MTFLLAAWAWIKKYWMWVVFPIGILGLVLKFLVFRKPASLGPVVAPELVGASQKAEDERREAELKERAAAEDREAKLKEVEEKHAETITKLTEDQSKAAEELRDDPDKLNDYLMSVGKELHRG